MIEERKKYTDIEKAILFNQVNGICPKCQQPLYYNKDGVGYRKAFEIAHIYPLNPTNEEKTILEHEEKLFLESKNELNNVIALCHNCHTYMDNPTTVESYRYLVNLKKQFINNQSISDIYSSYTIEEDLLEIINLMVNGLDENPERIEYNLINVDEKIEKKNKILSHKVKEDVSYYYLFIRKSFAEIDKTNTTFNLIAGQIKSFYNKVSSITNDQNEIYETIAKWIYDKFKIGNLESYKIIVSFFIQNCEVFKNVAE